jgi:hypothetical protein
VKCSCHGDIVCLICRAEIAYRAAGHEPHPHTWSVAGIKMMWEAMDAAKKTKAVEDDFGWGPT